MKPISGEMMIVQGRYLAKITALTAISIVGSQLHAANLDIANQALELARGVEPNIMILSDDSGSMDFGIMTDESMGTFVLSTNSTQFNEFLYTHPSIGVLSTVSPGANYPEAGVSSVLGGLFFYGNVQLYARYTVPSEKSLRDNGVAAPYGGVWRAWSSDYNKIYYNPDITYLPWDGLDSANNSYTSVSPNAALYNPYVPFQGSLNLTNNISYQTACEQYQPCFDAGLTGEFTVSDFYPARYYVWDDTDADGLIDAEDKHQLIEIRTSGSCNAGAVCPKSFTHTKFSQSSGIGRSDCGTDNGNNTVTCSVAEELQNFANWFSYYRKRDLVAKAALSQTLGETAYARIGFAAINDNANSRIQVRTMNASPGSGNKKNLFDSLFKTSPRNGTPLLGGLYKTGQYFACQAGDIFGSSGSSSAGSSACPVEAAPKGTCQANYTLIVSDGAYNDDLIASYGISIGNTDGDDNTLFDGGAFADSFSETLADIAMHFYERDLHTSLNNEVPVTRLDINRFPGTPGLDENDRLHQHMATYAISFGVDGTLQGMPSDPSQPFGDWKDPKVALAGSGNDAFKPKIDDLRHAVYNGRGQFESANNATALSKSIRDIFAEFEVGEGSSSSVAFNSQTIESDSLVFRAFFNSAENSGDLVAQKINVDGTLNEDANGNPIYEWSAAEQLDNKTSSTNDSRVIITYDDNGASSQGVAFAWSGSSSITAAQKLLLDDPQPGNLSSTVGEERLNYLRGQSVNEGDSFDDGQFREREIVGGKLGDIVHSTPVFVGAPPFTGRLVGEYPGEYPTNVPDLYTTFKSDNVNRQELVYVGANDGMLHAFNANNGSEVFAYVPNVLFNKLSDLTDPDYSHQFYVDLTPSVNDVFMNSVGGFGSKSWHTVLVNGLRAGGKGYFALNITDPSDFASASTAAQQVMWEFTETDDVTGPGQSDLGFSFSQPLIAMSNAEYSSGGDNRWVAIFGNGYNSTSTDGEAAMYILFLDEGVDGVWTPGSDFIKIKTGNGKAQSADGVTPNGLGGVRGIDIDGNGTVDRVYAGDLQGNLYRFDISSTSPSNWNNSANQHVLFKARYGTAFPRTEIQPITTRPIVIAHPDQPGHIVIFATGSWFTNDDAVSSNIQSIYGIWDEGASHEVVMTSTNEELVKQEFTNQASTEHGFTVRTLSNNDVDYKKNGTEKGWYIDLDVPPAGGSGSAEFPGERAVRNIQLRGGLLFVNTVIPRSSNPCTNGPGGFELGFNPTTGGSGEDVIFDTNNDGVFDSSDNVNDAATLANIVTGIRFDISTPTDASFISNFRITQTSDKNVRSIKTNTSEALQVGRNSWREIIIHDID